MKLSRPFVISTGSRDYEDNYLLKLQDDEGGTGWGESAPAHRVTGESDEAARRAIHEFETNSDWVERILEDAEHIPGGTREPSVRNALVTAHLDAYGRRKGLPLHSLLNLPEGRVASSVTISIGPVAAVLKEAAEWDAGGWTTFKVKLGGKHDEAALKALRDRYPEKTIRVDANEAWSLDEARKRLKVLETLDVEFVEQPMHRERVTELRMLAREFDIPIILDENVLDSEDVLRMVREEAGDGINIKLAKCGGPFEARRMVKVARDADWKVMMGCMIETGLGCAAGAAFAGVLDYADLDGNVLVTNDPFSGFRIEKGMVTTPSKPGVGVSLSPVGKRLPLLNDLKETA